MVSLLQFTFPFKFPVIVFTGACAFAKVIANNAIEIVEIIFFIFLFLFLQN
jgi:ABC-type multidrug transport system permease subunit